MNNAGSFGAEFETLNAAVNSTEISLELKRNMYHIEKVDIENVHAAPQCNNKTKYETLSKI